MKTNRMMRNKITIVLFCALAGCAKDKPAEVPGPVDPADDFVGDHRSFILSEETSDFHVGELTCQFLTADGQQIERPATHRRIDGSSVFEMNPGLKEGKYRLLSLDYEIKQEDSEETIKRQYGIGRLLEVKDGGITPVGSYSSSLGFSGSGTADDPYIISSSSDLSKLRQLMNDDYKRLGLRENTFFKQQGNIDMYWESKYCDSRYGWLPIGDKNTNPFSYTYDGGGYAISRLNVKRDTTGCVGLFGFVSKALIKNVHLVDANIKGLYAVGGIAGVAATGGNARDETVIRGCVVSQSTITGEGGFAIGGILGGADANAKVIIDSCIVKKNTTAKGAYGVGGILGGGFMFSTTFLSNCINDYATVEADYSGSGGIVGSADTLFVFSCKNSGSVQGGIKNSSGQDNTNGYYGAGGIAGGSGIAGFYACSNTGPIHGVRGVGGILGSSLISAQSGNGGAVYNSTFFTGCSNTGGIHAYNFAGGICGESQIGLYGCYNKGMITASYAGGIVGAATAGVIHNANNFGLVKGGKNIGGITGRITYGSLAMNSNFGTVQGGDNVAGVVGLAGSSTVLNYCANFAEINTSGNRELATGGIVGTIGNPREWSGLDIATCVLAVAEVALSVAIPICCYLNEGSAILEIGGFAKDAIFIGIDGILEGYGWFQLFSPQELSLLSSELKTQISVDYDKNNADMEAEVATAMRSSLNHPLSYGLSPLVITSDYASNRTVLIDYYQAATANSQQFNDRINSKRDARAKNLFTHARQEEIAHAIIGGVTLGCSIGMLATSAAITFGTGGAGAPAAFTAAIAVAGTITAIIGAGNSIMGVVDDFEQNAGIVSQCVNVGQITCADLDGWAGGIVGHMDESCKLNDCLNIGTHRGAPGKYAASIIGRVENNVLVVNSLNIDDRWERALGNYGSTVFVTVSDCYSVGNTSGADGTNPISPGNLSNPHAFNNWDIGVPTSCWVIPSHADSYPIPYKSEMQ